MSDYNKATKLQEGGDYAAAFEIYEGIEDYAKYKDTAEKVDFCKAMIAAIEKYDVSKKALEEKNSDLDNLVEASNDFISFRLNNRRTRQYPSASKMTINQTCLFCKRFRR